MEITQYPSALNLAGNMNHVIISSATDVAFVLAYEDTEEVIVEHTYSPNDRNLIEIDLKNIILPLLTFQLQDDSIPYQQTGIIKSFRITAAEIGTGGALGTTSAVTFSVIRAGVDGFTGDPADFLAQNFLTWQPNVKPVTYYSPEFLTYYATVACSVKCKAYFEEGDPAQFSLVVLPAGQCWTIPTQYAIIAGLSEGLPVYYDVWVENANHERLTYVQRYVASDMRSEEEEWVLFENSLGGIDCFRAYGDSDNTADHAHNVAEIEEDSVEYRVDTTRKFQKNTGFLGRRERLWLLDFFPSLAKYIYVSSHLRRIVVIDSDVNYSAKELPSSYNFTYKYADARPYLNLPRAELPQEVLNITVPDIGSFTIAPRLVEFPRLQLSGGALFPVQNPYSEAWTVTTAADLVEYIIRTIQGSSSADGGIGHTHSNLSLLEAIYMLEGYLTVAGQKIKAGFADKAHDLDNDSPIYHKFLRKDIPDTAAGKITFQQGFDSQAPSTTSGLDNTGDLTNTGDVIVGKDSPTHDDNPVSKSKNFNSGTAGWYLDNFGNMELESLTVRSFLEVTELLINRLQAQEGDTIFTDNDQITGIQRVVENEGTQNESVSYILDLKEKWEGYFTAQQRGNIVKGIINTLAAEQAGVIDGDDPDYINVYEAVSYSSTANPKELEYYERSGAGTEQSPYVYTLTEDTTMTSGKTYYKKTQGTDDGGNKYYTSWMQVVEDRNTEGSTLGNNQIRVVLYGDIQVPAQKNFEPCINMTIGRWGCFLNPNEDGISQAEKQSREKRQRLFFISASDGRIMKLRGVNKPILEQGNYGMTFGTIPDFMWEWSEVAEKALPNRDYMFAQGVICQSIIQVMPDGSPIPKYVDCGLWVDGGAQGVTPTVGSGIYLSNEYNELTGDWEIHDVWAYGCKWRCLQHQPVVSGNVTTYYPPKWNSNYWQLVEGNTNYSIEFVSSRGLSFRRGAVDTDITAYFYFGNIDITSEINAYYFNWTRHEERNEDSQGNITYTEQDVTWNAQHQGMKSIHLSNNDMPAAWSTLNKAIFTLTVTVLDGNQTLNIQNQIIS